MIATSIDDDITNRHPADILPQSANNKSYTKMIVSQSNDIQGIDNFPMGCSFSPDGTCILTATASGKSVLVLFCCVFVFNMKF